MPLRSRSWARRFAAVSFPCLVAAALAPETAHAQDASAQDIAQARQLGGQAQAAYDAGNFAESEKLWSAATRLYPLAPTLTLGLARTQAKLGKLVAAQENYNRIIREWGDKPSPPPAFKDALDAARGEVGQVSARVASVVITVDGAASPQVTLDGTPVNAAALGLKRPVDPGAHVVKASAEGFQPAETSFQVQEGGSAEAKLRLEKDPSAVAVGAAAGSPAAGAGAPPQGGDAGATSPPTEAPRSSSNKTLAIVAFGVGGAGLVTGAITGLIAMGKHSDLESQCPGGVCASDRQSDVDGYKTMGMISTVGFAVAGVGAAAGAVLLLTAPKQTTGAAEGVRYATPSARPAVVPFVGLGSAGVVGRF